MSSKYVQYWAKEKNSIGEIWKFNSYICKSWWIAPDGSRSTSTYTPAKVEGAGFVLCDDLDHAIRLAKFEAAIFED